MQFNTHPDHAGNAETLDEGFYFFRHAILKTKGNICRKSEIGIQFLADRNIYQPTEIIGSFWKINPPK